MSYESDFGLYFYNARWYDPTLGRFAQADTIVPPGVQGLDRYAYVSNNPLRYTDPTGHTRAECRDEDCSVPDTPIEIVERSENLKCNSKKLCDITFKYLSELLEKYLKTHPDYDALNEVVKYDWGTIRMGEISDFKYLRFIYWEERLQNSPLPADSPWLLYEYYDLSSRSININNSYWDFNNFDWMAFGLDSAATVGGIVGLNTVINAGKYGSTVRSYNLIVGPASLGYTASQNGIFSQSTALSAGGLIPGPAGAIFSGRVTLP